MIRNYLDYAGLKRVIGKLFGVRRIWHGTQAEWDALTPAERDYYDQAEIIDTDDPEANFNPRPDWANAVTLTPAQLLAGYAAPADGIFAGNVLPSSTSVTTLAINGVVIGFGYADNINHYTRQAEISCTPVSKGDIIKVSAAVSDSQNEHAIKFVPWKGRYTN